MRSLLSGPPRPLTQVRDQPVGRHQRERSRGCPQERRGAEFRRSGAGHDPGEESSEKGTRRSDEERYGNPSWVATGMMSSPATAARSAITIQPTMSIAFPPVLSLEEHMVAEA